MARLRARKVSLSICIYIYRNAPSELQAQLTKAGFGTTLCTSRSLTLPQRAARARVNLGTTLCISRSRTLPQRAARALGSPARALHVPIGAEQLVAPRLTLGSAEWRYASCDSEAG